MGEEMSQNASLANSITGLLSDQSIFSQFVLKELDHIQAIIGRYDTFYFLMKQICIGGIFAIVALTPDRSRGLTWFAIIIPPVFFVIEYCFRFFYWSIFVLRLHEIERFIHSGSLSFMPYDLNTTILSHNIASRLAISFQKFDVVYYVLWTIIALSVVYLIHHTSAASISFLAD
jgi:hypothetical protein